MTYAAKTTVSVRSSRMEIEDMLQRHNATRTFTAQEEGRAIVGFVVDDRLVQFELELPSKMDFVVGKRVNGRKFTRTVDQTEREWEQACRQKWRALVLALKSKFVSVETGIETTEQAFLAHIVMPNRQTVHRWMKAQLEEQYKGGIPLLPTGEEHAP